jgi:5-methylcytosine-specific restriction endonuclease McrA
MCMWRKRLKRHVWVERYHSPDTVPCRYCRTPLSFDEATLEHLIPVSQGGPKKQMWNLDISCRKCNMVKSSSLLPQDVRDAEANRKLTVEFVNDVLEAERARVLNQMDEEISAAMLSFA